MKQERMWTVRNQEENARARDKPKGAVTCHILGGMRVGICRTDRVDTAHWTSAGETRAQDRNQESPSPRWPP